MLSSSQAEAIAQGAHDQARRHANHYAPGRCAARARGAIGQRSDRRQVGLAEEHPPYDALGGPPVVELAELLPEQLPVLGRLGCGERAGLSNAARQFLGRSRHQPGRELGDVEVRAAGVVVAAQVVDEQHDRPVQIGVVEADRRVVRDQHVRRQHQVFDPRMVRRVTTRSERRRLLRQRVVRADQDPPVVPGRGGQLVQVEWIRRRRDRPGRTAYGPSRRRRGRSARTAPPGASRRSPNDARIARTSSSVACQQPVVARDSRYSSSSKCDG